jgi:NADPH-dependent curcumin reductase CurA
MSKTNHRVVPNSRPNRAPTATNFRLAALAIPDISAGQPLLRTLYLPLDS